MSRQEHLPTPERMQVIALHNPANRCVSVSGLTALAPLAL